MIEFYVEINGEAYGEMMSIMNGFSMGMNKAAFPNTAEAFERSRMTVAQAWRDYLAGNNKLDNLPPFKELITSGTKTQTLIESVKDDHLGDFNETVYSNNRQMEELFKITKDVEYDMKTTHPYGKKSRVSKDNVPYLIIPFRWGTPNVKGTRRRWNNVIPQKTYNFVLKGFEVSKRAQINGSWTHGEKNFSGEMIQRSNYIWKTRLTEDQAPESNMAGLVRMESGTKSTYFTFRIISAKSPSQSWWYRRKGHDGIDIIGALQRQYGDEIEKLIQSGVEADENMYKN